MNRTVLLTQGQRPYQRLGLLTNGLRYRLRSAPTAGLPFTRAVVAELGYRWAVSLSPEFVTALGLNRAIALSLAPERQADVEPGNFYSSSLNPESKANPQ